MTPHPIVPILSLALLSNTVLAAGPLATVNGEAVTREQLVAEFKHRHGGHEKFLAGEKEIRKALEAVIDRRLFLQEADRLGIPSMPEIAGPVQQLETTKMVDHLKKKEIDDRSAVSDAEVKAFYDTKTDELFQVQQIVVKARPEAESLLARLKAGEDFEKLARQSSVASSKAYGGLLTNLGWGSMDSDWEEVAFKLKTGQLSGVVARGDKFEILKMVERKKVEKPEYAKAAVRIRTILEQRRRESRKTELNEKLLRSYAAKLPAIDFGLKDLQQGAKSPRAATEVASWRGGKMTLADLADRLKVEQLAKLPESHVIEQLALLREELVRQELFKLEARARGYHRVPEVAGPVRQLRDDTTEAKLFDEYVLKGITVTDAEVKSYFDEHASEFALPERRQLAHLVVAEQEKAATLRKQLLAGKKWDALVKEHSTDPASSAKGGDLGWIPANQTPPDFEAVKTLKVGEISEPLKSQFGYHLIKVNAIEPARTPPFAELKAKVQQVALRKKMEAKRDFWSGKLRAAAKIQVHEAEVKAFAKEASL